MTQKQAMKRLNRARVGLKHQGVIPVREAIEEFRLIATLFFEENTPMVFGIEFRDISLVSLVQNRAVRSDLQEAEELRQQDKVQEAVGKVAVAFYRLLEQHARRDKLLSKVKWPTSTSPAVYNLGGSFGRAKLDDFQKDVL